MAGLSAVDWRAGPKSLSPSARFLCPSRSDLFLKPQLNPVLKRDPTTTGPQGVPFR